MEPPKRLVILGANLTALAVVRSAARLGIEPYVVDIAHGPAFESRLARKLIRLHEERSMLIPSIAVLGKSTENSWLVSTADAWTIELVSHRRVLDANFRRVLHPQNDALSICLSKERFAQWCVTNCVPAPRQYAVDPSTYHLEEVAFPAMVRPALTRHGDKATGVPKAREVNSQEELNLCFELFRAAKLTPLVTESLLGRNLTQISVGVAIDRGNVMSLSARKLRPNPEACRVGTLVETIDDPASEKLALDTLRKLQYEGIAEVEILKDLQTGSMYVIEINARPWLQFALGRASKRDFLEFIVAGGCVDAPTIPTSRRWLDFPGDAWTCFNGTDGMVRFGKLSIAEYVTSLIQTDVYARWSANDPWPFVRGGLSIICSSFWSIARALRHRVRSWLDAGALR